MVGNGVGENTYRNICSVGDVADICRSLVEILHSIAMHMNLQPEMESASLAKVIL